MPSIPSIIMGNMNSLPKRLDKLTVLCKTDQCYRESNLLIFSKTWLTGGVPDANVELPGFTTVRANRDNNTTGKRKGNGLILHVNKRWGQHVAVKAVLCGRDLELAAVRIRPYNVAREFSYAIFLGVHWNTVHVSPSSPPPQLFRPSTLEALLIKSGDFNHITLKTTRALLHHCVDCPTRMNRTIDLF